MSFLQTLINKLAELRQLLSVARREELYQRALQYLGTDASPDDLANDVVGCAESVTTILNKYMGLKIILGTATMYTVLEHSPRFKRVAVPQRGDIILSPTGMGNGTIQGHTGIVGDNGIVMSNSSATGKWSANFTIATWDARYKVMGGLPVFYYTLIN